MAAAPVALATPEPDPGGSGSGRWGRNRTNYARGAYFERTVAAALTGDGYVVYRAAGSHGKADLVALKAGEVLLVQCKLPGPGGVPPGEWNALYEVAVRVGALPIVAYRPGRSGVAYLRMTGPKLRRTRLAPAAAWSPDQVGTQPLPPQRPGNVSDFSA
ncbi:MAG TPA: Holliday junction resolvase [Candidatus Binatia bacterium]|nr:Holliday junction resolvase [Candidatus Binatia bacterium]